MRVLHGISRRGRAWTECFRAYVCYHGCVPGSVSLQVITGWCTTARCLQYHCLAGWYCGARVCFVLFHRDSLFIFLAFRDHGLNDVRT